jgi:gas vesicle protein
VTVTSRITAIDSIGKEFVMNEERRGMNLVVAFGAGAMLGAGAALLLAPKNGQQTRQALSDAADDAVDKGRSLVDRVQTKSRESTRAAGDFVKDQRERVGVALREGKEAYLRDASAR